MEENASSFTDDTATPCDFNIRNQNSVTENTNDTNIPHALKQSGIHAQSKHIYRNTFGESNIQYHNFDNQDLLTFTDKYTALLQQELQNPYWSLHDPVTNKVTKFQKIWTLRLCHMQCISPAIQIQSQRSITYHIKQ